MVVPFSFAPPWLSSLSPISPPPPLPYHHLPHDRFLPHFPHDHLFPRSPKSRPPQAPPCSVASHHRKTLSLLPEWKPSHTTAIW
ncbi:hypothetical protein SESBI_48694 [Sesbania bispinosa]|nr:hypothetical protein SESBI_48694 [Sesbania bispinosa]